MTPKTLRITCAPIAGENPARQMQVQLWGEETAARTVICVHGLTRLSRDFDFLAQALVEQAGYRVVCPDMAGRGNSDWLKLPQNYNYITYVADTLHMMEVMGLGQVDWVGTSMGGLIGMMVAANVPGSVRKLVLNDIGPFIPKRALERLGTYVGKAPASFADKDAASQYLSEIFASWGLSEAALAHVAEHSLVAQANGQVKMHYDPAIGAAFSEPDGKPRLMQNLNLWELWEKISCPLLVLRGETSDLLPKDVALAMVKRPNASLVEVAKVGHAPSLMEPGQIRLLVEWLRT